MTPPSPAEPPGFASDATTRGVRVQVEARYVPERSDPKHGRDLVWERLPPFYWCFPVLKAKPGAQVLARHDDPRETVEPYGLRPVLAVHRYGAGRVLFLAADETHRWRGTAENVFDRFWVQTTRFLLEGRLGGARRRFRVYLDRELVDLGDSVRISAELFDASFEPLQAATGSVWLSSFRNSGRTTFSPFTCRGILPIRGSSRKPLRESRSGWNLRDRLLRTCPSVRDAAAQILVPNVINNRA